MALHLLKEMLSHSLFLSLLVFLALLSHKIYFNMMLDFLICMAFCHSLVMIPLQWVLALSTRTMTCLPPWQAVVVCKDLQELVPVVHFHKKANTFSGNFLTMLILIHPLHILIIMSLTMPILTPITHIHHHVPA